MKNDLHVGGAWRINGYWILFFDDEKPMSYISLFYITVLSYIAVKTHAQRRGQTQTVSKHLTK